MPPGTPGFVGSRLREAREARLVTGRALAEMVGVTRSGISSYEHGHSTPSPDVLDRIARKLNFKLDFFRRPEEEAESTTRPQTIFERSRSSATKLTRQRARHHQVWLREIVTVHQSVRRVARTGVAPSGERHLLAWPVTRIY